MTRHSPFATPSLSMPPDAPDRRPAAPRAGTDATRLERAPLRVDATRAPAQARSTDNRFSAQAWRDAQRPDATDAPAAPDLAVPRPEIIAARKDGIGSSSGRPATGSAARWRYIAVWAGLGAVSAAYVAGMAWQRSSNFDVVMAPVTEALERIAADVAELRTVTANLDSREQATTARVAATESRLNGFAQAAQPAAAAVQPVQQAAAPQLTGNNGQRPTNRTVLADEPAPHAAAPASEPPKAAQMMPGVVLAQPIVLPGAVAQQPTRAEVKQGKQAPAASAVRTGSIASDPANPTAHRQPGLLVASGPSLDAVRLSWNVLTQNHGAVLGPLEPRTQTAGNGNIVQLIAGPFASDLDAQKACTLLRSRGVTCRMTDFAGAPL